MDSGIVSKMNEIIGILKMAERELASKTSFGDKQKLIGERKPAIEQKMDELQAMMSSVMVDAQTIKYHQQLKDEVKKILSVDASPQKRYI